MQKTMNKLACKLTGFELPLMITVCSISSYLAKVREENGRVLTGKTRAGEWGWWAEIADPEGNVFQLWEDKE